MTKRRSWRQTAINQDTYADRQVDVIRRIEDLERHTTSPAGGGVAGFFTVASSDLSDELKARCDYVCTGTADQDVINQALADADAAAVHAVVLVGGGFYCNAQIEMYQSGDRASLIGLPGANVASNLGIGGHEVLVEFDWSNGSQACIAWTGRLADLNVRWYGTTPLALVKAESGAERIENVGFYGQNNGTGSGSNAPGLVCGINTRQLDIRDNFFYRCGTAIEVTGGSVPIIDGNVFTDCSGHGIVINTTGRAYVLRNHFRSLGPAANSDSYIAIDVQAGDLSVVEGNIISSGVEISATAKWLYGIRVQSVTDVQLGVNTFLPDCVRTVGNELYVTPGYLPVSPLRDPGLSWWLVQSGSPRAGDLALFFDITSPEENPNGDLRSCSIDEIAALRSTSEFVRQKIYNYPGLVGAIAANDEIDLLDKSDTSDNALGTHKRTTIATLASTLTGASPIILPVAGAASIEFVSVPTANSDNTTTDIGEAITWYDHAAPTTEIAQLYALQTGGTRWMFYNGFHGSRLHFTAYKTTGAIGSSLHLEMDQAYLNGGPGIASVIAMNFGGSKAMLLQPGDSYIEDAFASTVSLGVKNGSFVSGFSFRAEDDQVLIDQDAIVVLNGAKLYTHSAATGAYLWWNGVDSRSEFVSADELQLLPSNLYVGSTVQFAQTIEALYNVKSYNQAGTGWDEQNFVAIADSNPGIGFQDDSTSTRLVVFYNGTSDVLEVQDDSATYKPINASAFNVSSSRATKEDIRPYVDPPPVLHPVRFRRGGREHIGLIAEDVAELIPEASDGRTIDYAQITAMQQAQINALLDRVAFLEARLAN